MPRKRPGRRDLFTVAEANAMLPLVRAIVTDLAALSSAVIDRRRRLSFLLSGRDPNDRDVYHQELVQIEEELETAIARVHRRTAGAGRGVEQRAGWRGGLSVDARRAQDQSVLETGRAGGLPLAPVGRRIFGAAAPGRRYFGLNSLA